jgi:hypothetical protein
MYRRLGRPLLTFTASADRPSRDTCACISKHTARSTNIRICRVGYASPGRRGDQRMMLVSALGPTGGCRARAPRALSRRSAAGRPKPRDPQQDAPRFRPHLRPRRRAGSVRPFRPGRRYARPALPRRLPVRTLRCDRSARRVFSPMAPIWSRRGWRRGLG